MKKKRFLAAILIACSAFLGTGYAWWSEGLQVEGVVSTGELKVVGMPTKMEQKSGSGEASIEVVNPIMDETYSEDIKGFSYEIRDLYPRKKYGFGAVFKNKGSIPAVVDEVVIETKMKEGLLKHIAIEGTVAIADKDGSIKDNEVYEIGADAPTTLEDLAEDLNTALDNWRIEPEETLVFRRCKVTLVKAQYDTDTKENACEGKNVTFDLKISFKQHNGQ